MTFFLHKVNGVQSTGGFWSWGLVTQGSITEGAAETAWTGAVQTFWGSGAVTGVYSTGTVLTNTSTSTATATFRQTTKTVTTLTLPGTDAAAMLPEFCAIVASLYSGQATKYGHGRWYLPSPTVTALATGSTGHIATATATGFATALSILFASLTSAGLAPTLVTRRPTISGAAQYSTRVIDRGSIPEHFTVQTRRGDKIIPIRAPFTV